MGPWPGFGWRYGALSLAIHGAPLVLMVRAALEANSVPSASTQPIVVALLPSLERTRLVGAGGGERIRSADAKADAETDAKADADTDAKADAETDAKADADTDAKADAETDAKADASAPARNGASANVKEDAKAKAQAETFAKVETKVGTHRKLVPMAVAPAPLEKSLAAAEHESDQSSEGTDGDPLRAWAKPGSAIAAAVTRMMPLVHWSQRTGFGIASVAFHVSHQGYVQKLIFKRSSGDVTIDQATEEAIHMAEPFGFVAGPIVLDVDFRAGKALLKEGRERLGLHERQNGADERFGQAVVVGGPGAGPQLAAQ